MMTASVGQGSVALFQKVPRWPSTRKRVKPEMVHVVQTPLQPLSYAAVVALLLLLAPSMNDYGRCPMAVRSFCW
jgi:hypothetical protein